MTPRQTSLATLTIHDAPAMGTRGRKRLASWLRHAAELLEADGAKFSKRFTARYLVPRGKA